MEAIFSEIYFSRAWGDEESVSGPGSGVQRTAPFRSKSRYLLTTTFIRWPRNTDIETGGWRQINLQIPPFEFPTAIRLIDEKCEHSGGVFADKRLGLWDLTSI
jgi:hypothetical protein